MILDLVRALITGAWVFLSLFNRRGMTNPDDRAKVRLFAWLFPTCILVPAALVLFVPWSGIGLLFWITFAMVVILEGVRLLKLAIGFTTTRSRATPVTGLDSHFETTHALQVRSYELAEAPHSLHGLTVAFVSDLHCDGMPSCSWYDRLWNTVRGIGPDILILGGDYLSRADSLPILDRALRELRTLRPSLGIWAVLGNHDLEALEEVRLLLRRAGVGLLEDSWVVLDRGDGRSVVLHGTGSPWTTSASPAASLPPGGADLSVTHTPDNAPALAKGGARTILAGHIHGGQIALPILGAILSPSVFSRRWTYGCHTLGNSRLVVSSGCGVVGIPLRILTAPEIVLLRFWSE